MNASGKTAPPSPPDRIVMKMKYRFWVKFVPVWIKGIVPFAKNS
jgi:hypothetical protein